jgi:Tfp pilus assembly protein PilF
MKRKLLSAGIILIFLMLIAGCSTAGNYYKDGKKNFESKNYEKAADCFKKAIDKNPNRADYFIAYGLALTALGRYEESIRQFDLAYRDKNMSIIRENNKKALRGKGIAYYHMQEYKKAVKEFKKALQINELPEVNMDILYYMGSSQRAAGLYENAIQTYNNIIKKKKSAQAFGNRAFCYLSMGSYDKSLTDYDKAISLDTDNYDYYFGKYFLLSEQGNTADAKAVLDKAAKIKVQTKSDQYNLAKLHYYLGDYKTALTELEKSCSDGFSEAYYYTGEIYRNNKDYTKAIYYYEKYIQSGDLAAPNVYNQIAVCLMKAEEYKKAIEYLEKGIAFQNPSTLKILMKNEIIAYEGLSDFETSNEKLKKYLESYPEDKDAAREADFIGTRLPDFVAENANQ